MTLKSVKYIFKDSFYKIKYEVFTYPSRRNIEIINKWGKYTFYLYEIKDSIQEINFNKN